MIPNNLVPAQILILFCSLYSFGRVLKVLPMYQKSKTPLILLAVWLIHNALFYFVVLLDEYIYESRLVALDYFKVWSTYLRVHGAVTVISVIEAFLDASFDIQVLAELKRWMERV